MGSCASRSSAATPAELVTAKVVDVDGSMAQFAAPVTTACEALVAITGRGTSRFLCSSDELYFDAPVRALGAHDVLQAGQLYFALPLSMLQRALSGQDMAALAVKASAALGAAPVVAGVSSMDRNGDGAASLAGKRQRRRQSGRVAPLVVVSGDESAPADGDERLKSRHVCDGNGARKAAAYGGQTVGKTRHGASYTGGTRRLSAVQRLSVIVEEASE